MRHQKRTVKLGRESQHRDMMLANLVLSLIEHGRIKTTLAKAKAAKPLAEKVVTLGKKGGLHHRRLAIAKLKYTRPAYQKGKKRADLIRKLFEELAPKFAERQGGYTRIIKLGPRQSDSAPVALLEWVDAFSGAEATEAPAETKAKKSAAKKADEAKPVEAKVEQTPAKGTKQLSETEAKAAAVEDAEVVTDADKADDKKTS